MVDSKVGRQTVLGRLQRTPFVSESGKIMWYTVPRGVNRIKRSGRWYTRISTAALETSIATARQRRQDHLESLEKEAKYVARSIHRDDYEGRG